MISQQGLPPDQRYLETVVHNIKRREDSIEAERTERQDDIERLAR
jgi:antitoxin component of RelBE/YafQ-DinJ toxin-antitoxin module